MAQKFMVRNLNLKGFAVPCIVEVKVIGMDKGYFLICGTLLAFKHVRKYIKVVTSSLGALAARMFCMQCQTELGDTKVTSDLRRAIRS